MVILQQYILELDGHRWRGLCIPYEARLFRSNHYPSIYFSSRNRNHFEFIPNDKTMYGMELIWSY
jgi:hypothetical protein